MPVELPGQVASLIVDTLYEVVADGLTATTSGLLDVTTGVPPFIAYVHGPLPVNAREILPEEPLHISCVPLTVATGTSFIVTVTSE